MTITPSENTIPRQNWSSNIRFQAKNFHAPASIEELQKIVRTSTKVKVVGSAHCFSDIADSTETLISLSQLGKTITVDHAAQTATVPAGMPHAELAPLLHREGVALKNMASIPQFTVIGACMTATHGSGDGNGNLATHVAGIEMVKADGELVQLSRETHGERFNGMVVALGGLGVVTRVTLEVVPAFSMRQTIYRGLPLDDLANHFDEIMGSGYSVSLFTPWKNKIVDQIWVKEIASDRPYSPRLNLFGATAATEKRDPLDGVSAERCTEQMGIHGPWYNRLPHFHIHNTWLDTDELQTEYFVSRENAVDALLAVEALNLHTNPAMKVCEVRTMKGDDLWLSMAYGRNTVGLHFSWYHQLDEATKLMTLVENALAPFDPRPHWGKLHTMPPEQVIEQYKRMAEFRTLRAEFDPEQKFVNPYIAQYLLI